MTKELDFINMIGQMVIKYPSDFFNSVSIAQACLETGYGTSELYIKANNCFGYKYSRKEWPGDKYIVESPEEIKGALHMHRSSFRKYNSVEESVKDHADMLSRSDRHANHYREAINAKTPEEQAMALTGTYATDSKYGQKLIEIINKYGLKSWDNIKEIKKESEAMSVFPKPKIVDRRRKALGYPGHGVYPKRPLSAIKNIVWHYTATTHAGDAENIIAAHESYWRNHHGWDIGGYAYYIDRQGKIVQNYDLEVVTYGAGIANPYCLHISLEASDENNYTPAQIKSREELTLWLLTGALKHLGGSSMRGHKEMPGNSTSCPGYSISKLNALRSDLTKKLASKNWVDTTPAQISTKVKGNKYVVKHGDTLWAISKAFGVSLDQLREWNGIKEGQWLKTGQTVYVKAPTAYNTYTVVKGDYLYKIATKYGVTVAEIKEWNDLETNLISVGQELLIAKPLQIIDKKDEPKKPVEPKQETEPIKQVEDKGAKTPALEFGPGEHLEIHKDGKVYVVKNK